MAESTDSRKHVCSQTNQRTVAAIHADRIGDQIDFRPISLATAGYEPNTSTAPIAVRRLGDHVAIHGERGLPGKESGTRLDSMGAQPAPGRQFLGE